MTERERDELTTNRRGLWRFYVGVNPPVQLAELDVEKGDFVTLNRGRLTGPAGTFYATFVFRAAGAFRLMTNDALNLDMLYVRPGHLVLVEAWLDDTATNHESTNRPVKAVRASTDAEHPDAQL